MNYSSGLRAKPPIWTTECTGSFLIFPFELFPLCVYTLVCLRATLPNCLKKTEQGECCDIARKTACVSGILYGHQSMSWLHHFSSSFLLGCLGEYQRMTHVLGSLHPRWRPGRNSYFLASGQVCFSYCHHLGSEPAAGTISLCNFLSLSSYCNPIFQTKKYIFFLKGEMNKVQQQLQPWPHSQIEFPLQRKSKWEISRQPIS